MAAKSDFAQKLLNDLRLRKERMGVSQGSARNHATTRDAYRDPGNVHRGSRHTKSFSDSKSINQQLIPSRGSNSSNQIVSYAGRQHQHQRSESTADLSMAFTYAGKLMNIDFSNSNNTNTMIDFLNQISRRSLQAENKQNGTVTSLVKHRSQNAPALTTVQIKEISRGVQNLYEIIRSTSNGANVNRYSMEVGKELLKGAKGLEESLRMLVNLQEASELMVNTQRKSRITLLEVDDDKDEDARSKVVERNQVALPRFSFDKPSKKSNSQFADGFSKFPTLSVSAANTAAGTESVRSGSYAKPTSEKGRISNVIAKLMGLEEVSAKVDSYPHRDDLSIKNVNRTSRPVKDSVVPLKVEPRSKKTSRPSNDRKPQQVHDSKHKRQTNGELKEKLHTKRRNPEVVENLQVERTKTVRTEKSNEIKLVARRVQKSKQDSQQIKPVKNTNLVSKESKPQPVEGNPKAKDPTPKAQEPEQRQQKMVPVARKKVDSIAVAKIKSPRTKEEVLRGRNLTINNLSTPFKHKLSVLKETNRNEVRVRSEPKEIIIHKANSISSVNKTEPKTRTRDIVPVCENESKRDPQIALEIFVAGTNAGSNISKEDSISNANKTEATNRLVDIVPVCKNETNMDSQTTSEIVIAGTNVEIPYESNLLENGPKKAFYSSICENETKRDPQTTSEIVISGTNARIPDKSNLAENKILDKSNISENKPKKTFYSSIRVVLTEQEKQLKEILIKDQLFLSTAEALFKLNIPVGFLHVDDNNHHNNETKLKLDCGYEILKRKARSQELSFHPYIRPSIGDTSIRFLDELVKQLYKDLESVRYYGRDMCNEYDEADYLHMLENDIHNKYPDINSFWDFGWHITTFAFVEKDEFVNDVEQDTFSRLVDEFVDELLSV